MQSQKDKGDRRESAAHIKKLVAFNSLVVTPLVERLSGRDAAMKEMAELLAKAAEEAKKEGGSEEGGGGGKARRRRRGGEGSVHEPSTWLQGRRRRLQRPAQVP